MDRDNLSTEHQPEGSAGRPKDTLDRGAERQPADRSPMEDAGAPGGTAGTGGTTHEPD